MVPPFISISPCLSFPVCNVTFVLPCAYHQGEFFLLLPRSWGCAVCSGQHGAPQAGSPSAPLGAPWGSQDPTNLPDDDSHQHRLCLCRAVPSPFLLGDRGESSRVQAKAFLSPPPTAGAKKPYSIPPECNTAFLLPPTHIGEGP